MPRSLGNGTTLGAEALVQNCLGELGAGGRESREWKGLFPPVWPADSLMTRAICDTWGQQFVQALGSSGVSFPGQAGADHFGQPM